MKIPKKSFNTQKIDDNFLINVVEEEREDWNLCMILFNIPEKKQHIPHYLHKTTQNTQKT